MAIRNLFRYTPRLALYLLLSVTASLALLACGGSDDGAAPPPPPPIPTAIGHLLSAGPAEGVQFRSGGQSGYTGPNGEFRYEIGNEVEFSLGKWVIGRNRGAPVITPLNFSPETSVRENIIRTLQTFSRAGAQQGIVITRTAAQAIQTPLDMSTTDLAATLLPALDAASRADQFTYQLADAALAQRRFLDTWLCLNTGRYRGDHAYTDQAGKGFFLITPTQVRGTIARLYPLPGFVYDPTVVILGDPYTLVPTASFEAPQPFAAGFDLAFTAHASEPEATELTGKLDELGKLSGASTAPTASGSYTANQFRFPNAAGQPAGDALPYLRFSGIGMFVRQFQNELVVADYYFIIELLPGEYVRGFMTSPTYDTFAVLFTGRVSGDEVSADGVFYDYRDQSPPLLIYQLKGTVNRSERTFFAAVLHPKGDEFLNIPPETPLVGCPLVTSVPGAPAAN